MVTFYVWSIFEGVFCCIFGHLAKCHVMQQIPYVFNQLTAFIPKHIFDRLVVRFGGNDYVKSFTCWNHLLVMIWAQLTSRRSLRDIETSLRAHYDKTYRMGMGRSISRNTIANANARRDVAIYRQMASVMMELASGTSAKDDTLRRMASTFKLSGFFAVDSSTVSLPLNGFPWSVPQKGWGGIKIHTMFDLLRNTPRMCVVTGHEERDQTFMEDYIYEPGCFYIFDKMYFKSSGFMAVHKAEAYFVTRMKKKVVYEVVRELEGTNAIILADRVIRFNSRWARHGYPYELRHIHFYSQEKNEVLGFLTNNFELDAATIALLYRYRWQIELFFKWIKQHLRIVSFYGTSANAVMIQIYTAFITFCLLSIVSDAVKFDGSLYEFANLVSVSLTEKEWLENLIRRSEGISKSDDGIPSQLSFEF